MRRSPSRSSTSISAATRPAVETALVTVSSSTEGNPETVIVTEDGADSPRFGGAIALAAGTPVPDGRVQASNGDVLTVSYADADDGHGGSGWRTATARADCRGPAISGLVVDALTNARATRELHDRRAGRYGRPLGHDPRAGPGHERPRRGDVPPRRAQPVRRLPAASTCASRAPMPPGTGRSPTPGARRTPSAPGRSRAFTGARPSRVPPRAGRCRASGRSAPRSARAAPPSASPTPSPPTTTRRSSATT